MAFHKSNNPSFAKQGFSPTDHLCGSHLHINWKLLGVKKVFICLELQLFPCSSKVQGSSFPTVQPSQEKPQADCRPGALKLWGIWMVSAGLRRSRGPTLTTRSSVPVLSWAKGSLLGTLLPATLQQCLLLSASCGWRNTYFVLFLPGKHL